MHMLASQRSLLETIGMASIERALVVGNGGREQAIGQKLVDDGVEVLMSPGNPGNETFAESSGVYPTDIRGQLEAAISFDPDLTIVGGEASLAAGIVDAFQAREQPIFGPTARQTMLEADKYQAKKLARRRGIPIGEFKYFAEAHKALEFAEDKPFPLFIKDIGLRAGKGVARYNSYQELEHDADNLPPQMVVELGVPGPEISAHSLCGGRDQHEIPFVARDYKYLEAGDKGPLTGSMGSIAPVPGYSPSEAERLAQAFVEPVLAAGPFTGVLFSGLKGAQGDEKLLEWNVRFGDSEAQVFLSLLESPLLPILRACAQGDLNSLSKSDIHWRLGETAVCLVLAAPGYPNHPQQDMAIEGLDKVAKLDNVYTLHAGTDRNREGQLVTAGGRVLSIICRDSSLKNAVDQAYQAARHVKFDGRPPLMRSDIGKEFTATHSKADCKI